MNPAPETVLSRELAPEERLLWSGRPVGGVRIQAMDAVMIPFSLIWCGFAVFWEYSVIQTGAPLIFKLWGIPFLLVGLYFVVGRFFSDAYARKHTVYGVTSRRVLIASGVLSKRVRSLPLPGLADMTLVQHSDGTGSLQFGMPAATYDPALTQPRRIAAPAFSYIRDAREVQELILRLQKSPA